MLLIFLFPSHKLKTLLSHNSPFTHLLSVPLPITNKCRYPSLYIYSTSSELHFSVPIQPSRWTLPSMPIPDRLLSHISINIPTSRSQPVCSQRTENFPFDIYHIFCHEIACVTHTNLSWTETRAQDQLTDLHLHPTLQCDAGESLLPCHCAS